MILILLLAAAALMFVIKALHVHTRHVARDQREADDFHLLPHGEVSRAHEPSRWDERGRP